MSYVLGIDVGTDYTSAATCQLRGPTGYEVDVVRLGARSSSMASVLYLSEERSIVVGDAAQRRAPADHSRVARGFSRRIGDDVPLVVAGVRRTAQELTATLTRWVVGRTAAAEGAPPEHVVLTHPASWGPYRRGLLHRALRGVGVHDITLLPEPIAAAENHAARDHVEVGSSLAVYRLGSSTFESSVVRRTSMGTFELLGSAETAEDLGGTYFEDVLIEHVRAQLGRTFDELDLTDPRARAAMYGLRYVCTEAKERLSVAGEAVIPVQLPHVRTQVRLTRAEFAELIRPAVETTVEALQHTVHSCGVPAGALGAVLLVGGSSRIPLVAELVAAGLPCSVAVEPDPEATLAKGAALAARRIVAGGSELAEPAPPQPTSAPGWSDEDALMPYLVDEMEPDDGDDELAEPPPRPAVEVTPLDLPERRSVMGRLRGGKPPVAGAAVVILMVLGAALMFTFYSKNSARPGPASPAGSAAVALVATATNATFAQSTVRQPIPVGRATESTTKGRR